MKVYFVGAGPGAADLITLRGRSLIETADVVIYAGSLVCPDHLNWCRSDARIYDSAGMNLDEVTAVFTRHKQDSGHIVRLHTGDPSVYGAIQEQMDFLRKQDIPFEVVPGVSSFQAASAVLERQLTLPGVSQTVILSRVEGRTAVPEKESLEVLAAIGATLVLFLSVNRAAEVQSRLVPVLGADTPAAVVYRASWPDQEIRRGTLGNLSELAEGIRCHALMIIGRVLDSDYELSKLYDSAFSHGFRRGNS